MNLTDEEKRWAWNNELAQTYIVNDVFLVVYLILGIFGNATVMVVYGLKMKKKADDRFFIPYLAFVDLVACTTRSSFELAMNLLPVNFRGAILCKVLWFPVNVSSFSSMFLLLTISLQRYLKVCRPFGKQMTLTLKKVALIVTFILSIALSMPLNIWNDEIEVKNEKLNITGYMCDARLEGNMGAGFILFVVCITVLALIIMLGMIIFNTLIGRTIYIQLKLEKKRIKQAEMTRKKQEANVKLSRLPIPVHVTDSQRSDSVNHSMSLQEESSTDMTISSKKLKELSPKQKEKLEKKRMLSSHSYSYMFMVIAFAFMLSYLPQFILLFVGMGDTDFWVNRTSTELAIFSLIREMNVINNIVNPFVYGFFDRRFREETKKMLRSMKCW